MFDILILVSRGLVPSTNAGHLCVLFLAFVIYLYLKKTTALFEVTSVEEGGGKYCHIYILSTTFKAFAHCGARNMG